mmetsp:Transcript_68406/g.135529  ORF Transcript_68406/g.135529 Transcript_68406/m.135529 type:complete len:81 (+) Transcript_68406:628-870(+)
MPPYLPLRSVCTPWVPRALLVPRAGPVVKPLLDVRPDVGAACCLAEPTPLPGLDWLILEPLLLDDLSVDALDDCLPAHGT